MRIEHEVVIGRPVEEVFAALTDAELVARWQSGVAEVRREGELGELAVGTRLTEVRTLLGKQAESTLEVVEHEPPRRFALRVVRGPVPVRVEHTLEAAGDGTRLRFAAEADGRAVRLGGPLLARALKKQSQADFQRLKALLED